MHLDTPTRKILRPMDPEATDFGIGMDPADGLLRQGADGYQLTWMDAKVEGALPRGAAKRSRSILCGTKPFASWKSGSPHSVRPWKVSGREFSLGAFQTHSAVAFG